MQSTLRRSLLIASIAACGQRDAPRDAAQAPTSVPETSGAPLDSARALGPQTTAPTEAVTNGCPGGMARFDRVCIDRFECHLVTRTPSSAFTPHPHFLRPKEGEIYEARSTRGVFPQAYISRVESDAACTNVGKRLCSRSEWQRACMGARRTTFPYGARPEPGRCNTHKAHLLTLRFGADTRSWRYEHFNDPALDQEPGFLAKSGEHDGCVGEVGAYDLVGNLHEWVSDTADTAMVARLHADGVSRSYQYWSPGNGVFMGGFFSTQGELGPGCTFTTVAHDAAYHDYSTGFRCCSDASGA